MTRMYNSLAVHGDGRDSAPFVGVFGPGWSSNLDMCLQLSDEGTAWVMADGRQLFFVREGERFARVECEVFWLDRRLAAEVAEFLEGEFVCLTCAVEDSAAVLVLSDNQGVRWFFSLSDAWLGSTAGPGTTVSAVRDADGFVTSLVHELGRSISVEYRDGRVLSVVGGAGGPVFYTYDRCGRVTSMWDSKWGSRSFVYDAAAQVRAVGMYAAGGGV